MREDVSNEGTDTIFKVADGLESFLSDVLSLLVEELFEVLSALSKHCFHFDVCPLPRVVKILDL